MDCATQERYGNRSQAKKAIRLSADLDLAQKDVKAESRGNALLDIGTPKNLEKGFTVAGTMNKRQQRDRERLRRAYDFFTERLAKGESFHLDALADFAGWKPKTVGTYPSKQWEEILEKTGVKTYKVLPAFNRFPFDVFANLNSQKQAANKDPFKPILSVNTERLVRKSRESALAAVQIFNSPTFEFKTPSYLVHMVIAWVSLLHAIFEEEGTEYWYKNDDGSDELRNGHRLHWDLARSLKAFFKTDQPPERKNLELFVELRNEVEHRFAPEFDLDFSAECQACLLNYERQLVESFGEYFSIGSRVSIPLQLSRTPPRSRLDALRELHSRDYEILKDRLNVFRASLSEEIYASQDYAFRVFLVPKPANRLNQADMTIEFIKPTDIDPEAMSQLQKQITLIKTREIPVVNKGLLKPRQVVALVQQVEPRFRDHEHTLAWKGFGVRPLTGGTPDGVKSEFCLYDEANKQYLYTAAWVEKLQKFCKDPNALAKLREMQPRLPD
ncbi:MAG: DUF3644 domain-containing protein [Vulcanimicrobiota bacterium]